MNITTHIMELFRAMKEDEQLELVAQIGAELSAKGIDYETLTGKPLKPKAKATGKTFRKGWWMKRIENYNPKKKGVFAIEGDWLGTHELSALTSDDMIVVGWKHNGEKQYTLAKGGGGKLVIRTGGPKSEIILEGVSAYGGTADRFGDLTANIKSHLAIAA